MLSIVQPTLLQQFIQVRTNFIGMCSSFIGISKHAEYERFFGFSALYKRIRPKKRIRLQTPPVSQITKFFQTPITIFFGL